MKNNNTEIDLLELLVKVFNYFKKYLWLYAGSVFLGVAIAFFVNYYGNKQYKANIIITTNNTDGILLSLFESLSEEINDHNVSKSLNLSPEISENIESIEIKKIVPDGQNKLIEENLKEYYRIDLILKDSSYFKQVKNGLKYFIKNNNYLKKINDYDKSKREELINNIEKEIMKFDSLRYENVSSNVFINNDLDFKDGIVYLYEKKNYLEKKNKFSNTFEVIKDFNISPAVSLSLLVFKYVFGFIFLAFITSILIEVRELVNNYSNSSKPNN